MKTFNNRICSTEEEKLYHAVLQLKTVEECFDFFRDLCTPAEISAMKERWRLAQLLDNEEEGLSYREIAEKTGASIATIGRVARFLKQENYQGYRRILDRIKSIEKKNKKNEK